jgi:hypothetical protein
MAASPPHRFGQIVGNILEEILLPVLQEFCVERGLYLDRHGVRVGVRKGSKVAWEDKYGNTHDLDFAIEKDGSATERGRPVAFIEAAWRRYTKHSRNKAQEIQGAVLPIVEKYASDAPFLGAVLAGEFTTGSLHQLKSHGFEVVYFPYESIVGAFHAVGIDAAFDEDTPDDSFARCIRKIEQLSSARRKRLKDHLLTANKVPFDGFVKLPRAKLDRIVVRVIVSPLFGDSSTFSTATEAEEFIDRFDMAYTVGEFRKYELAVVFSNKDEIGGTFASKDRAKDFLRCMPS